VLTDTMVGLQRVGLVVPAVWRVDDRQGDRGGAEDGIQDCAGEGGGREVMSGSLVRGPRRGAAE